MTKDEILAVYDAEKARLTASGESGESLLKWACKGTRTRVHEAMQAASPPPERGQEHVDYHVAVAATQAAFKKNGEIDAAKLDELAKHRSKADDAHHERQKAHFKDLWEKTDAAVAACGISEGGVAKDPVTA